MKQRPLSPHLTIYKPQITSVLSILHRISGVVLFLGMLSISWVLILGVYAPSFVEKIIAHTALLKVIIVCLLLWSMALFYHLVNGIKYLFWSVGLGYSIAAVKWAGWIVISCTILLTAAVWFILLNN
jgi:succinate dehydrogenase / fumarate reductase cytochrome b subunit